GLHCAATHTTFPLTPGPSPLGGEGRKKLERSSNMSPHFSRGLVLVGTLGLFFLPQAASLLAADEPRATGVAPPNHVILSDTLFGSYFVAAPLKEQYDRLLSRVETLKRELDTERVTGAQAEAQLTSLRDDLQKLRESIERSKVLVPAAKVHAFRETTV